MALTAPTYEEQLPEAETNAFRRVLGWVIAQRPRGLLEALGVAMLAVILFGILVVPLILRLDPYTLHLGQQLQAPSVAHPFGTDALGRDYLARVLYGGRVSVWIGVLVVFLAGSVGIAIGGLAGFIGGIVDEVLMRIADIFLAFPTIILALVVAGSLGPSLRNSAIAIAVAWWPAYARVVRGQVIVVKERDFVTAERALGANPLRLLVRTVLPNSLNVLKVIFLLDVASAVLAAATLSYFGLGVRQPDPEWGVLIREAVDSSGYWWLLVIPGSSIMLFAASINFAGGRFTRSTYEHR